MSSEKTVSLEERFEHIEEIIEKMETGDITLDKSFELYKNGLEEIKAANAMLDDIEKAMLVMNEDGSLEEF
ncbi:MAG: exodeoxyribonuclease VII small subunit [Agathobacter sp.]|nr:exodeoxyribonuclease VII small subunit [Agathobacter sp.]MBQ3560142.1 exodeoxyribonuclease VII small subunit [Agathobacter sp.]